MTVYQLTETDSTVGSVAADSGLSVVPSTDVAGFAIMLLAFVVAIGILASYWLLPPGPTFKQRLDGPPRRRRRSRAAHRRRA